MRPRDVRLAMMREVEIVIEKDRLGDRPEAQVPGALAHVAWAPGVVGILQRAPVEPECPVANEPAHRVETERVPESELEQEREQGLRPEAADRLGRDVAHELPKAPPLRGPILERP